MCNAMKWPQKKETKIAFYKDAWNVNCMTKKYQLRYTDFAIAYYF